MAVLGGCIPWGRQWVGLQGEGSGMGWSGKQWEQMLGSHDTQGITHLGTTGPNPASILTRADTSVSLKVSTPQP